MSFNPLNTIEEEKVENPILELESEHLPAIKNWEAGRTYSVLMKLKMTEKKETDEPEVCGFFEVVGVRELPEKKEFSNNEVKVALDMKKLDYLR